MTKYTVMVELVDRMSETGMSGPYPVLITYDLDRAKRVCAEENKDRYTYATIKSEEALVV